MVNQEETKLKYSHNVINKKTLQTEKRLLKAPSIPLIISSDLISVMAVLCHHRLCIPTSPSSCCQNQNEEVICNSSPRQRPWALLLAGLSLALPAKEKSRGC